jgi:hypothetical protein
MAAVRAHKVQLAYFRLTGKFLTFATCLIAQDAISDIWEEVHELRRMGRLPGLRPNAGRDLIILIDVVDHPERLLHIAMPPFVNEEDSTPVRVPVEPLVRIPLEEIPRTTTRDVVKPTVHDDDVTPVDVPLATLEEDVVTPTNALEEAQLEDVTPVEIPKREEETD